MIKVIIVFGTRPEAIKMYPVIKELESNKEFEPIICVTAQHREMLDQVLKDFNIKPKYDLNIMTENQTLSDITTKALIELESIIKLEIPNIVLVHGDTTTTFVSALASFYNQIPIGHIEAGLRTYNKYSPYPEEINREMVSCMADYNFAPTIESKENLLKEGRENIYVTGNTAIDTMKYTINSNYQNEILTWASDSKLILLTAHRRENMGKPLENIFNAIKKIVEDFKDVKVIYPIHLNPKIREVANKILKDNDRIKIIEPLEVIDFHNFMNASYLILTDSGGIQEEAPFLHKPVLVLRSTTERPEGLIAGTLKLVGTNEDKIYENTKLLLTDKEEYEKMSNAINPYGDGFSSKRIADILLSELKK